MRDRLLALPRRVGLDVSRHPPRYPDRRRGALIRRLGVTVVLDVGANEGQYARALREPGNYTGRIVSLEPGGNAFERLQLAASGDPNWETRRIALMESDGEMKLTISQADNLNSFLPSSDAGRRGLPGVAPHSQEVVPTARLDSVYEELAGDAVTFLKLDVQGAEGRVLAGAPESLRRIVGIQLELPLLPIYEGQQPARALIDLIEDCGLTLAGVEPGFFDQHTGRQMEFDATFIRRESLDAGATY